MVREDGWSSSSNPDGQAGEPRFGGADRADRITGMGAKQKASAGHRPRLDLFGSLRSPRPGSRPSERISDPRSPRNAKLRHGTSSSGGRARWCRCGTAIGPGPRHGGHRVAADRIAANHPIEPIPTSIANGRCGASSPIRRVVSHRLQSADSGRSTTMYKEGQSGPSLLFINLEISTDHSWQFWSASCDQHLDTHYQTVVG